MLSAHIMGSHGHQSLPFGYDPNGIHGIGLPPYQQPPPPGQPLLSDQESEQMTDFFSTFDGETQHTAHPMSSHYGDNMAQLQLLQMPQTYVGHETYVPNPQTVDWQSQRQMGRFQFGNQMNQVPTIGQPASPYVNGYMTSPATSMFSMHQNNISAFNPAWQQPFAPQNIHSGRPDLHFGTDHNFMNDGYAAPEGPVEADVSLLQYAMAPTSSASNTQPNSRPSSNGNTEPSSPVVTKRRKLNVFQTDSLRMTSSSATNGNMSGQPSPPPTTARGKRKSFVKHEQQPPTPLSKTPTIRDDDEDDDAEAEDDAEYDEDDDTNAPRSASPPAPWPGSKPRPAYKPPPPPKPSRSRKKSTSASVSSPAKPPKVRRTSSGPTVSRVPLTAEQKKANHTNSEQRRRDATAKSYADLYDRVPEIEAQGKMSTMKKLEMVVDKVKMVKSRVEYIRFLMGRDPTTGAPIPGATPGHHNFAQSDM